MPKPRSSGRQPTLFEPVKPPHTVEVGPEPTGPSLLKMVIDNGVRLLVESGRNITAARNCMGWLLREYDAPYIAKVIEVTAALSKDGKVAEPFSFMRKLLQDYPRKQDDPRALRNQRAAAARDNRSASHAAQPPARPRPLATAESLGMSSRMSDLIKQKTAALAAGEETDA